MNWSKSSTRAQEDFKKLKVVNGSLKARWEGAIESLDEMDLSDDGGPLELEGLEPSGPWDRRATARENPKGWSDWSDSLSAQLKH